MGEAWGAVPPAPEATRKRCPKRVVKDVQMIRDGILADPLGFRKNDLEKPRPKELGNENFAGERRAVPLTETKPPLAPKHNRYPEGDADEVVEMFMNKATAPQGL